jgi:integrase/recombinase XerD
MVRLPSGVRYWTVLDEELAVVPVADAFLWQVRFGRDSAESTTKAYAGGVALFLRWCTGPGRSWEAGAGHCRTRALSRTAGSCAASRSACRDAWVTAGPAVSPAGGGAASAAWIFSGRSRCR